jgi:aminoglycoside phosphotransferase (APT) family kinase protein
MTTDVATLDTERLQAYLEQNVDGFHGPISAHKFANGQSNPTFKLQADSGTYVLRRQPPGKILKSAHAVDREYRVLRALRDTKVPVPDAIHLCEKPDVIGTMFYLMGFCEGRVYFPAHLPEIGSNAERAAMYDALNEVLVAIHTLDLDACGLADYGKSGAFFERQLGRWTKQYRDAELHAIVAMDALIEWLQANQPQDDGRTALVHGDYRIDNVIFHPQRPEIIAVLDWELSTIGHPIADLAYQCMQWRLPNELGHHQGLGGIDRAGLGIPTEREYVQRYCERSGDARIDHWTFLLALSFFRLGAIIQGVAKRAVQGNASSKQAAMVGQLVGPLAGIALATIEENPGQNYH